LAPKANQDVAIIAFVILAGLAIVGSILAWIFHIPPFR